MARVELIEPAAAGDSAGMARCVAGAETVGTLPDGVHVAPNVREFFKAARR